MLVFFQGVERSTRPHCGFPWPLPCVGHPSSVLALQLQLFLRAVHGADRCCLLSQGKKKFGENGMNLVRAELLCGSEILPYR